MPIELPTPISRYFIADQDRDAEAVTRCFTDSAIVKDAPRVPDVIRARFPARVRKGVTG